MKEKKVFRVGFNLEICKSCGAKCCKLGGADVSLKEAKILNQKKINLIKLKKNHFWTGAKKGVCLFLKKNNSCKIYKDRPMQCRCYPVIRLPKKNRVILLKCPLTDSLSDKEILRLRKKILSLPKEIFINRWKQAKIKGGNLKLIKKEWLNSNMQNKKTFYICLNKKKLLIKNYLVCDKFFSKLRGLMFRSSNFSTPLLFIFKKSGKYSIHSFFCKKFLAVWYLNDKIIDEKIVEPFKFNVTPKKKFNLLLEIPLNFRRKRNI